MTQHNEIDWNANEEDLQKDTINEWEYSVRHSNDKGESDQLNARVDPALARIADELIIRSKGSGINLLTRSDLVRLAVWRFINHFQEYLGLQDEHITHYLLLEKDLMRESNKAAMLERVITSVQKLGKGMSVLANRRQDWQEINKRVTEWLNPVLEMRTSEPYLAKMYIREFFEINSMKQVLEQLEKNYRVSKTIREAKRFYEKS